MRRHLEKAVPDSIVAEDEESVMKSQVLIGHEWGAPSPELD